MIFLRQLLLQSFGPKSSKNPQNCEYLNCSVFFLKVKKIKVNKRSSMNNLGSTRVPHATIQIFKAIEQMVLKRTIFNAFYNIWPWRPSHLHQFPSIFFHQISEEFNLTSNTPSFFEKTTFYSKILVVFAMFTNDLDL